MVEVFYVDCYLPLALSGTFTYRIPEEWKNKLQVGSLVVVPFNERNIYTGIVKQIHVTTPSKYQVKDVIEVLEEDPVFTTMQFKLLDWICEYYLAEPGLVYHAALPAGFKISTESKIQLNPLFEEDCTFTPSEERLIEGLKSSAVLSYADALKITRTKTLYHIIQSLKKKKAILLFEEYKHQYKPKIVQKIRLNEKYVQDKELLKALLDSLAGQNKQENILLKYLQHKAIWNDPEQNKTGIARNLITGKDFSASALKTLIKKEVFEEFKEIAPRETFGIEDLSTEITLSEIQHQAFSSIVEHYKAKVIVLLHGITGSGKTEIYIQLIKEQIAHGKQVLFLMPEIALTTHMTGRLAIVFGQDLTLYHSKLSENERVESWKKVQSKEAKVILGARSAIFLPYQHLGLIIVDEEHDASFKQNEKTPRYQARDSALILAKLHHAKTLLGSATPSLESYHFAKKGVYGYVRLDQRHGNATLPLIELADLKKDRANKGGHKTQTEYTALLIKTLEESIKNKEQALLFQNRRGYAPYLFCETCGWVAMCIQCDVSLTYHQKERRIKCHYCGHQERIPATCPACGSGKIITKGIGTEKIEEDLALLLPGTSIKRMDQDTTRAKDAFKNIYEGLKNREIDLLVGTQMITKGLDFDNIVVAGIVNADQMMFYPDFRANERAFQMLTQVAGRTGRREKQGKVIVQTYNPHHYLLQLLKNNDLDGFYEKELQEREKFNYPPFTRIVKIIVKDRNREICEKAGDLLVQKLKPEIGQHRILGPEWPPIDRINNFYLKEILLKFEREKIDISKAKRIVRKCVEDFKPLKEFKSIQIILDVDPY